MKTFMDSFAGMDFGFGVMILFLLYITLGIAFSFMAFKSLWILIKSLYKKYVTKK